LTGKLYENKNENKDLFFLENVGVNAVILPALSLWD
jgi:hypothetical protein